MKKKLYTILCAILLCFTTFMLSGCGGGSSGGNGGGSGSSGGSTGGSTGGYDFEDAVSKPSDYDFDGNASSGAGKDDLNTDDLEIAQFEDYFSGYRVLIDGDENFTLFDDATKQQQTFNYLLNRQITTLAQDILYRLYAVYGNITYPASGSAGISNIALQYNLFNNNYSIDGSPAVILKNKILTTETSHSGHITNIDCIYCYQKYITENANLKLNDTTFIKLTGAIQGNYQKYINSQLRTFDYQIEYDSDGDGINDSFKNAYDPTNYRWKYFQNADLYSTWETRHLNTFKMAIAKILVGDSENYLQDNYNENDYNNLLNRINRLGYLVKPSSNADSKITYDDEKVLNYIEKNIIGETLINESNRIYNKFSELDKFNVPQWTNDNEIEKHYYKGYNIILPNIVKMAFNNTFNETEKTLYPTSQRAKIQDGNFQTKAEADPENGNPAEMTTTGPIKFNSLVLKPLDGSLLDEFTLSVAVARDSELGKDPEDIKSTRYIKDIYVTFKVNMVYVTEKGKGFNQIVTASHEEETLTIDSAGCVPKPPTIMGEVVGGDAFENAGYLPFQFSFSVTDYLDDPAPAFGEFQDNVPDVSTVWNNPFIKNDSGSAVVYNAGPNYLQISFVDVVVMRRTNTGDVVYTGNDVVYDISVMPLNM